MRAGTVRPYVVQELWDDDDNVSRWTSEEPGVTGPYDLEETAHLQDPSKGWRVYWVVPVQLTGKRWEERS